MSELGPVSHAHYYFNEVVNSRGDLKDGELLGVRVPREGEDQHFPRLPGESEKACFARVKVKAGGALTFPIRTMMFDGKLVVSGTRTVKFPPLDWRKSGSMKYDGFVLLEVNLEVNVRKHVIWRDGNPCILPHTEKEIENRKEMTALQEQLRREFLDHPEWSREERNKQAKRHGFRVIYPDSPDREAMPSLRRQAKSIA